MRTEKKTFVTSVSETINEMFAFLTGSRRVQTPKPIKKVRIMKDQKKDQKYFGNFLKSSGKNQKQSLPIREYTLFPSHFAR